MRTLLLAVVANAMHVIDGSRRPADSQAKAEFATNYLSALDFFRGGPRSTLHWIAAHVDALDETLVRRRAFQIARANLENRPRRFAFSREWIKKNA